jgi:hypothetical protein
MINTALRVDELLDEIPSTWSGPHVGRRLTEAMRTLRMLPMGSLAGYGGTWPVYAYEFDDLVAQKQQGELERTQAQQNRIRLLPSLQEIGRMEIVIGWPATFLNGTNLARAVNCVAFAHSLDLDAGWVSAKRGGDPETWRKEHDEGCGIIASALQRARVPVF